MMIPSNGTLRMTSTYTWARLRTMKFFDSRATPISVPNTVARTMPVIARRSVLSRPTTMRVVDRLGLAEVAVRRSGTPPAGRGSPKLGGMFWLRLLSR